MRLTRVAPAAYSRTEGAEARSIAFDCREFLQFRFETFQTNCAAYTTRIQHAVVKEDSIFIFSTGMNNAIIGKFNKIMISEV